jgi:hypothetical protein
MSVLQYTLIGAAGGALVEALDLFKWITVWQGERRTKSGALKESPPSWKLYVDVPKHVWLLVIRVPLGAAAAWLFSTTDQISGAYAALGFGFAAPAILAQVGSLPGVDEALQDPDPPAAGDPDRAPPPGPPPAPVLITNSADASSPAPTEDISSEKGDDEDEALPEDKP